MKIKIAPSILSAKAWDLDKYCQVFEDANIDLIHYDVMDGNYVPNLSLGTKLYSDLHDISNIPLDLHLMVEDPTHAVDYFDIKAGDQVCFHPDTCNGSYRLLQHIQSLGAKAGIALSPGVPLSYVCEFKSVLDFVLLMTVEPGFSAQKMVPDAFDKVSRLKKMRMDIDIFVDGNVTVDNISKLKNSGANGFVVGSALINDKIKMSDFASSVDAFRKAALGQPIPC